jgi:hypothetical protein
MTEEEWLAATDPRPMLEFLRGRMSDRKLRLFASTICRQFTSSVAIKEYVLGIEAAESYADGSRTKAAMNRYRRTLKDRGVSIINSTDKGQHDEWRALYLCGVAISEKDFRSFPL